LTLAGFTLFIGGDAAGSAAPPALADFWRGFSRRVKVSTPDAQRCAVTCDLRAGGTTHGADPPSSEASAASFCFDGWLENATELAQTLGLSPTAQRNDRDIALAAWQRWGDSLGDHLYGEYSLAIWDRRERRLFALRDRVGVRPLFYAEVPGGIVVANLPGAVAAHPAVGHGVDAGYAAEFLCNETSSEEATLFAAVQRLPGGHQLDWRAGHGVVVRRYWRPSGESRGIGAAEAQEQFADLLRRAVASAARSAEFVASDLSGGIDSSSVAVQLGRMVRQGGLRADQVAALSLVYPGLACDESPYIDAVVARLPYAAHRFTPRYATLEECEAATAMLRYPYFPFNSTGAAPIVDFVRDRGGVLLSGEGGDELFEPVEHALRQALVRPREWAALRSMLSRRWADRDRGRSWLGTVRHAVAPFGGQWLANLISRHRDRPNAPEGWPVDPEWAKAVGLRDRVDSLLYPRNARTLAMGSALSGAWSPSFEWLFFASCVTGVETRHPLSSARLIEFCNQLPLGLLDGQQARNRVLLRLAGGDDLSAVIAERTSKAEFTPATLPPLLARARSQTAGLAAAGRDPAATWRYRVAITGARHIWRLDAALAFEMWLRTLPPDAARGFDLTVS